MDKKPRSRKEIMEYLLQCDTHSDYHEGVTYARNVKLHGVYWRTEEAREVAGWLLDDEGPRTGPFWDDFGWAIEDFEHTHLGYQIIWEGRSGGWLVLVTSPFRGRLFRSKHDLTDTEWRYLKELFEVVWAFNRFVSEWWDNFIQFCYSHHIVEREEQVMRTIKYREVIENADS